MRDAEISHKTRCALVVSRSTDTHLDLRCACIMYVYDKSHINIIIFYITCLTVARKLMKSVQFILTQSTTALVA